MDIGEVTWSVMAHPARLWQARPLATLLGATLVMDDGGGENATADRAWSACPPDSTWHIVVQDDAVPVPHVVQQARDALSEAPTEVVSFYYGTGYPTGVSAAAMAATGRADEAGAGWMIGHRLCWGVAVALRAELVPAMLAAVAPSAVPYDRRLAIWAVTHGLPVGYTWPSLFDHADGPSLVRRVRPLARRAHRVGVRPTWAVPSIQLPF